MRKSTRKISESGYPDSSYQSNHSYSSHSGPKIFDKFKQDILRKMQTIDKSKKGSIDERIVSLCDTINKNPDFVTLSSCAGRILLIRVPCRRRAGGKKMSGWEYVTHDVAKMKDVVKTLHTYADKHAGCAERNRGEERNGSKANSADSDVLYFRQESVILHIACRTIQDAEKLIILGRACGFRRNGIITSHKKIVVELICMEHIYAPVFDRKILVDDSYLSSLVKAANVKLKISWESIGMLERGLKRLERID